MVLKDNVIYLGKIKMKVYFLLESKQSKGFQNSWHIWKLLRMIIKKNETFDLVEPYVIWRVSSYEKDGMKYLAYVHMKLLFD